MQVAMIQNQRVTDFRTDWAIKRDEEKKRASEEKKRASEAAGE